MKMATVVTLPSGTERRVHVNKFVLERNKAEGKNDPAIAVRTEGKFGSFDMVMAREVVIDGPCRFVYRPDEPMPPGATCWAETRAQLILLT